MTPIHVAQPPNDTARARGLDPSLPGSTVREGRLVQVGPPAGAA